MLKRIEKQYLGDDAVAQIRNLIIFGKYPPGMKLVERDLGSELAISRTPVRDALKTLLGQGFVRYQGKSLEVCHFNSRDVDEIYPLIANIEGFLLSSADSYPARSLGKLRTINGLISSNQGNIARQVQLDIQWHSQLVGESRNQRAAEVLLSLRQLAARYDFAFASLQGQISKSASDHEVITELVARGDTAQAVRKLKAHWLQDLPLLKAALT
ncbi:GntR family transcriptional regulator [Pseudomonadota bacterium]